MKYSLIPCALNCCDSVTSSLFKAMLIKPISRRTKSAFLHSPPAVESLIISRVAGDEASDVKNNLAKKIREPLDKQTARTSTKRTKKIHSTVKLMLINPSTT